MRMYFAGGQVDQYRQILSSMKVGNFLFSYYFIDEELLKDFVSKYIGYPANIFIDSGGFSARMRGVEISVYKYGEWLLKNKDFNFVYANLDQRTTEETIKNQEILEKMGLKPIPVFHYDEWAEGKMNVFDYYLKKHDYIALGGTAGTKIKKTNLFRYYSTIFNRVKNKIKLHGFGQTNSEVLKKFPFYSVDSTSWNQGGKYGSVVYFNRTKLSNVKDKKNFFYKSRFNHYERNNKNIKEF